MKARDFSVWLIVALVVGLSALLFDPDTTLTILGIGIPVAIASAIVSTIYLYRVFQKQPLPRSRFFAMVLELFYALILLGAWVGYLTVARLTNAAVPLPPLTTTTPISALLVIIVFMSPARFAIEVWRVRRQPPREGPVAETHLDRLEVHEVEDVVASDVQDRKE
ncbi:MAG: hypothetical protein E6J41_33790 [Chloroflexi bacterium]|nr:MAG: hypothetical protein E6J41_33790 [Chloroflexota bacterium]